MLAVFVSQPAASAPESRYLAGYPLAGLRSVAHRLGPHLWPREPTRGSSGSSIWAHCACCPSAFPWRGGCTPVAKRRTTLVRPSNPPVVPLTRRLTTAVHEGSFPCHLAPAPLLRCRGSTNCWAIRVTCKGTSTRTAPSTWRGVAAAHGSTISQPVSRPRVSPVVAVGHFPTSIKVALAAICRHRRDRGGQRDGGRAGQQQGSAALDSGCPSGARRRAIPRRIVQQRPNRGLRPDGPHSLSPPQCVTL